MRAQLLTFTLRDRRVRIREEDIDELASAGIKISRLLSCSPRRVKLEEIREIYGKNLHNG